MKKYNNIYNKVALPICVAIVGLLSSCSLFDDFLTVYPTNQITGEQFWKDKTDLESVVFSCYKQFQSDAMSQRIFAWGELRSDNFVPRSTDDEDLVNLMEANLLPTNPWFNWASVYKCIGYCNLVLSKGQEVVKNDNSFNEQDWTPIDAEMRAMRALCYFYLVRTFRDVPFNITSTDTSEGVRQPVPQMPSQEILSYLIDDLEACKDNAMVDYGNEVDNHGRITRDALYTILADMYLWRASKNSTSDSIRKYRQQYKEDYQKCIELCDAVLANKILRFKEKGQEYYGSRGDKEMGELPIYVTSTLGQTTDVPYNEIFGNKNSLESIFEIEYSQTGDYNSVIPKFLGGMDGNSLKSGLLQQSAMFTEISTDAPDVEGTPFYQSDLRVWETFMYANNTGTVIPSNFAKYIVEGVETKEPTDVTKAKNVVSYSSRRSYDNCDANFVIYRTSEVVLMKAEALTCLGEDSLGFEYANAIFDRSNPKISANLKLEYENYNSKSEVLSFIFRERQREFYGEGKRWFDLVRMALRDGKTSSMLNLLCTKYASNANAVKAKMATMNSLYSPVYKNEMKVNSALIQNPAWKDNDTSERN